MEDRNAGTYEQPPYLFVLMNQTSLAESFVVPVAAPVPMSALARVELSHPR